MEVTMERIEQMKEQIRKEQEKLDERRKRVREMEKELFREQNPDEVILPELSPEILEEAADITIRELYLVADFSLRFMTALIRYAKITTLKEFYEWISAENPNYIRDVGTKTIQKTRLVLQDIPDIIEKVKNRRKNIRKHDTAINNLIDDPRIISKLASKGNGIRTLTQLYDEDVKEIEGIFGKDYLMNEGVIVELLRRY